MKRIYRGVAALSLCAVACSPGQVVQTDTTTPSTSPSATAVPTTAPAQVPTVPPTAIPLGLGPEPSPPPTATVLPPVSTPPTATATPAPASQPTVASDPAVTRAPIAVSPTAGPSGSQAVLVANGAEVYTLNCARCHGESGLGSAQYSGLIGVGDRYSTGGMISELTSGHPVTFGFADKLSSDEIASVVAYVKATFP